MAYCPLAQGGRLRRELMSHPKLMDLAEELSISVPQLLLAWVIRPLEGKREVLAIPKAVQTQHVIDNATALAINLSEEVLAQLDNVFPAPNRKTPLDIV